MHIYFFLFSFVLFLVLSLLFFYKEFILVKEMYGVQRAWTKLSKKIWIWIIVDLLYGIFFSWSVNHGYQIEYIPINLLIVFQFSKSIYERYKGGAVILNCGQLSSYKSLRFGQICFVMLSIIQLIPFFLGISKGLVYPIFTQLLILVYALASSSLNLEFREKGIALAYGFIKWKDIRYYHLVPLVYKKPGHIILQTKIRFPLATEYWSTEIPEKYWHNVCEILEQHLLDKRI